MPNWKKVILSGSNAVLAEITASGNLSGSRTATASYGLFTGSFGGNGTNLDLSSNTSISTLPFPFEGDAQISGSLIVSQSYTVGDTDSTALRLIGSGSVSQSGIFEVEGSAGPLFSVADGLDGVLMEVNNISGLPLFQVSSSNEVFINRGNLTSGVNTATASFANFSGSFQGDGTNLNLASNTTIPAGPTPTLAQVVTEGASATGDVLITGSLTISGSFSAFTLDSDNIVLGSGSGVAMQASANNNVILGTNTADSLTTGDQNVAIGHQALQSLSSNSGNTAIGFEAAKAYTNSNSVFIGYKAGLAWSTGNDNVVIGKEAADSHTAGSTNVYIGYAAAGGSTGGGSYNLAIGGNSGKNLTTGTNNVTLGKNAGFNLNSGKENIAIGTNALDSIASGEMNIAIGYYAGASLDNDDGNIMIGFGSAADGTGNGELKIGSGSITTIQGNLATGDVTFYNTASAPNFSGSFQGNGSQLTNLPASDPFPFSGDAQITGSLTVSGSLVPGGRNRLSTNNVVIGRAAGENMSISSTSALDNTLIGAVAGNDLTSGNNNVLVGYKAGEYLTTSQDVIAIGKTALGADSTAGNALNYVIAIGTSAGGRLQGGIGDGDHHGIYIGRNAGINIDSNDGNQNNILIGHRNVGPSSQGHFGEGHLRIGQGTDSNAVIFPISASLTSGSVLIPQLKVDSVNTANSASGATLTVEGSGSTVFEVIGSEGTLFAIDDDLDGTIFTANDKTGLPVLEASASGEVYIGKSPQSLYTTAVISSNNANVTQSIYGLDTSSYGGAFFEYTAHSGSNARAGSIMSVWNGSSLNFTETTTTDIGSTSDLVMKVHISESQAQLAAFSTTAGYNIKTIIKSI